MDITYMSRFERQYKKLPTAIQEAAEEKEKIFQEDPFAPSLATHKLQGRLSGLWSFSIGFRYRILFEFIDGENILFHAIGNHDIYE